MRRLRHKIHNYHRTVSMNEFTPVELVQECKTIADAFGRRYVAKALHCTVQAVGKALQEDPDNPMKYYDLRVKIMALGGYEQPIIKFTFTFI